MHLTQFTDYSLRVLIYLGLKNEMATVAEISEAFGISRNHLVKVAHRLAQLEVIESYKGKSGGIKLVRKPEDLNIGKIIRMTEPHFTIVECFNPETNSCPLVGACDLERVLGKATEAFFNTLDSYTLADLMKSPLARRRRAILNL